MIQLNLLPPKVRAAELLRKIVIGAGLAYALGCGWLAWQWSLNDVKLMVARHEVEKVQRQLDAPELQVAVQAVQKFADDMAAVKAKASVVNTLRRQQVPLMRLLDAVPDWTMNGEVWFTALDTESGRGGHTVTLEGSTLSRELFAQFYDFLGSQILVKNLSLNTAPTDSTLRNAPVVHFKVGFTVEDQP